MAVLSTIASDVTHTCHQIDQLSLYQATHHHEFLQRFDYVVDKQNEILREQAAAKKRDEDMLRMHRQTIDQLALAQQRIDAILIQNYELHEYPIPRLFVILPSSYDNWDLKNVVKESYRLHFLCECGEHCNTSTESVNSYGQHTFATADSTSPISVKNSIHLAKHEGYELSRPTEFFEQYGPYVLGMLWILKHCLAVATVVTPAVALAQCSVKEAMDSDTENVLGNLYRITTEKGHVKWVCLDHYRQVYRATAMASFLQCLKTTGGTHNPQIGRVTIKLKSGTVFKDFFSRLSTHALAVSGIKVAFDRYLYATDLAMLVEKISLSNVRDVHLDFQEFKTHAAIVSQVQAGHGRYNSLLGLLSNTKIRSLTFTNVGLFGPRTSRLPTDQRPSLLQSFHFSGAIRSVDDPRLADVISHCPHLVDLRLGAITWLSEDVSKIDEAIRSLSKLEVIRRYHMYAKSWAEVEATNTSAPYGSVALREIVDFGLPYPTCANGLLEEAIRLSSATLEVLLLRPGIETCEFLHQICFPDSLPPGSLAGRPIFSKLTHLELFVDVTPASLKMISSVLPGLPLVHFGVGHHTSGLLVHANYKFLKSLYLKPADQRSIDALYRSIVEPSVPLKCQIESLRLDWMLPVKAHLTVLQRVHTFATGNKLDFDKLGGNLKMLSEDSLDIVNRSINFIDQFMGDGLATSNEEEEVHDSLEGLFDIFAVFHLKTLILERIGGQGLETVLKLRSLSQLQVLIINDEKYRWGTEAILAARCADFAVGFTVQLVYNTKKHLRDVYKTGSRKQRRSSTKLSRQDVRPIDYATFEKEYYSAILPSFPQ
ncbi:hypothetical protein BGZ96_009143 [Linnemannia gamsii]|uniref:Uncharacterized protein n=1 Tax=Linnemannia gamsii TaxID=64522 RepID=A0ABQ7KDG5_9FUNG|nr:hypothetical protein BGZ96_009143 [Linnemannia gamsii]